MENKETFEIHVERLPFQQIPDWVFESDISTTAIKLYLVLRKNGDNERGTSFWSRKKLGEQMRCSAATVDRAKNELVAIGAICYINRTTDVGDWTSNLYHIHTNPNQKCRYLHAKMQGGSPKNAGTPSPKNAPLTNNHNELRTNELSSRAYTAQVQDLANLLADLIAANGVKRPNVTDKWFADIDRLQRIDGYSYEQIERVIRWAQADSFWQANILSPGKLRKQFSQLQIKIKNTSGFGGWANVLNKLTNEAKNELS